MKIGLLTRWLPPSIDGVGDYTWNLALALRQLGVKVDLFTSIRDKNYRLPAQNEDFFPIINQWQAKAIVKALKTVIRNAPDWFCFQYVPQMYGRWGVCWQIADLLWELKNEFRCKIAVTFHEFIWGWGITPKDIFLASATRLQTRRILSKIDLAITTCNRYKYALQCLLPHSLPITVIPVGSNVKFATRQPRQNFCAQTKILGLFGRLSSDRNFSLAIRALERARQEGLDARLYLLGNVESSNPKLFKDSMQLAEVLGIKSRITVTGVLSEEDLSIRLKMIDVFIFPQNDGISTRNTALMAALAGGLPIVSFKPQPGNFDNFHIPCAVLVDKDNKERFVQAVVESLKHSDTLSKAAQANSDYYYRHFSWPIIAQKYLEVLEN